MESLLHTNSDSADKHKQKFVRKEYPIRRFSEAVNVLKAVSITPDYGSKREYWKVLADNMNRTFNQTFQFIVANAKKWNLVDGRGKNLKPTQMGRKLLDVLAEYEADPDSFINLQKEIYLNVPIFRDMYALYGDLGYGALPKNGKFISRILDDFGPQYNIRPNDTKLLATEFTRLIKTLGAKDSKQQQKIGIFYNAIEKTQLGIPQSKQADILKLFPLVYPDAPTCKEQLDKLNVEDIESILRSYRKQVKTDGERMLIDIFLGYLKSWKK